MSEIQDQDAKAALELIIAARREHRVYTYQSLALALERDPETDARAVAQVCDKLDAACAYAGVPQLPLAVVRTADGRVNPKSLGYCCARRRERVVDAAVYHRFSEAEFTSLRRALAELEGLGNTKAWARVRELYPD